MCFKSFQVFHVFRETPPIAGSKLYKAVDDQHADQTHYRYN